MARSFFTLFILSRFCCLLTVPVGSSVLDQSPVAKGPHYDAMLDTRGPVDYRALERRSVAVELGDAARELGGLRIEAGKHAVVAVLLSLHLLCSGTGATLYDKNLIPKLVDVVRPGVVGRLDVRHTSHNLEKIGAADDNVVQGGRAAASPSASSISSRMASREARKAWTSLRMSRIASPSAPILQRSSACD